MSVTPEKALLRELKKHVAYNYMQVSREKGGFKIKVQHRDGKGLLCAEYRLPFFDDAEQAGIQLAADIKNNRGTYATYAPVTIIEGE